MIVIYCPWSNIKRRENECKLLQVVQHKEGKSNGSFFQDLKFDKHEIFQVDKFW